MDMPKQDIKRDSFVFEVDSQLIGELGERLVTRNHVGLSELAKNAYDADSPSIEIKLENISQKKLGGESSIKIVDKGEGMSFDVLENHWMTIGTTNKHFNKISKLYGRPRTGNKGIGRFACQKLAETLEIYTVAETPDGFHHTTVWFNWSDFEPGIAISKVHCKYEHYVSSEGEVGTTLLLKNLRQKWTESDYKMLIKNISSLSVATPQRRPGYVEDPGFEVVIESKEFEKVFGDREVKLSDEILKAGWGTISGLIEPSGSANFTLISKGEKSEKTYIPTEEFPLLSGVNFEIHIIPFKIRDGIENRRNPTVFTSSVIKRIQDEYSGIKLYLNSFRIYPYGDINNDDDWLGITKDIARRRGPTDYKELQELGEKLGIPHMARVMLNHPGTRSLIGSVYLSGKTVENFQVKMDREGLVETDSFKQLTRVVRLALDWATIHYESFLIKERRKRSIIRVQQFEESIGAKFEDNRTRFARAVETLTDASNLQMLAYTKKADEREPNSPLLTAKEDSSPSPELVTKEAKEYVLDQFDTREAEIDTLRSVSATAPLLFIFAHEVKGISHTLLTHTQELRTIAELVQNDSHKETLLKMAKKSEVYRQSFNDLFTLFDVFSDSTNFSGKKASYKVIFDKISSGFSFFTKQFDIRIKFPDVSPIKTACNLNQAEVFSLFVNILSNSIKSLIASSSKQRIIEILLSFEDDKHIIIISDNGVGLSEQFWESVFEPFIFDPENKLYRSLDDQLGDPKLASLGKGSGLGLHIVKSIVEKHKGTVVFIPPQESWKACIRIEIPKKGS